MEQIEFKNLLKEREELIQKLKKINNQINFYQNKLEIDEKKIKNFKNDLNSHQILRYGRHLIMNEIGINGQKKICSSSILIVGMGGLGSTAAFYLAGAGVGIWIRFNNIKCLNKQEK